MGADNIAGVSIPAFNMTYDAHKATAFLIKLASLQTAFKTLDEEIKMTSRRVNALEYVLIPRIEEVIAYIILEMDEQTREEFFRVKKVVEKKKAKLEKEKLLMELEAAASGKVLSKGEAIDAPSMLACERD